MIEYITIFLSGRNFLTNKILSHLEFDKECEILSCINQGDDILLSGKNYIAEEGEIQVRKRGIEGVVSNIFDYEAWYVSFLEDNYKLFKKFNVEEINLWVTLFMTKGFHAYEVFNAAQLSALGRMKVSIPIDIHIWSKKKILEFAKDNSIKYEIIDDLF